MQSVRYLAAQVLDHIINKKGSLATQLPIALNKANPKDRALVSQLVYGSCRYFPQLSIVAHYLLRYPIQPQSSIIQAFILIGLYELSHMRTPAHAAVASTVDAVKETDLAWAVPLCNGVLREFIRQQESIPTRFQDNLAFISNHPSWLQAKLANHWPNNWQDIVVNNDQLGPMTLRIHQRQTSRADYLQMLAEADIAAIPCAFSPWGVQLVQPCSVETLPKFTEGWVSVQDEAAQLAPLVLDIVDGQRVLDACSAPGGKACHILEQHHVELTALESSSKRIGRLQDNLSRLKLSANILCADGNDLDTWWDRHLFDRILLDAPCSATGVIRRNPDIKILRTSEDIIALNNQQLALLNNLWPTLAVGGILVYATCSVLKQENERIIKRFLGSQADAQHLPIAADWGVLCEFGRQLFPQSHSHDGFYYAKLQKLEI